VRSRAVELYRTNLLTNRVYSELPAMKGTIVARFLSGEITSETALSELAAEKDRLSKFVVVAGIKTTDGETGSVGPQVAEGVSELLGNVLPHATYVEDFEIDPASGTLSSERKIGYLSQRLEMQLPALITVSTEYRPRSAPAASQAEVRANSYRGKVFQAFKWTADDLGADPKRLGLAGSPTIVGTGVDVGRPPVQKTLDSSLVFLKKTEQLDFEGKKYGPFARGDLTNGLPAGLVAALKAGGSVGAFGYGMLVEELFA
jgi:electron transfer flavoprotein beta subunit